MHTTDIQRFDVIEYNKAVEMMSKLQMQRIKEEISDTLLILEHPEIVTVGPRARNDGIHPPADYATQAVDRGGGLTWHGPGQLVVYPIIHWDKDDENSVAAIIYKLETWVIESLATLGIEGYRDERMQGVWVEGKKICSIGLSFLRWVSRHGFTINYNTPMGRVENLAGCGLSESTTTSLNRLNHSVSRQDIEQALLSTYHHCLSR
ncbi:lipoyl(octanoyl) transferase LipB [Candidatus Poseidoniales archaeon]|nr:lipoyl(octanoyl) transferase LipB [Candidatus Poseidoniales archaeon]MDA8777645.1 lipoyl(octanoyl) transferase LipB [Candidatus Poseidoniales archaeon]MDB2366945.1 lipoyl(octanoyl) transferase LipB [Candidatus Poseidoniales archaeon]MDB2671922.1 lipoyl(octanoyl) transferase LipB [Candidatus Poseidoniales archaeon]|tara:strand:- start:347 stop:964 length:618 start_codon:yes stop_codon:yes gene_type:complete